MKHTTFTLSKSAAAVGACLCMALTAPTARAIYSFVSYSEKDLSSVAPAAFSIGYDPSSQDVIVSFVNSAGTESFFEEFPYYSPSSPFTSFGPDVAPPAELNFITCPANYSGGWEEGDVFVGDGTEYVMRLNSVGETSPSPYGTEWATLSSGTDAMGLYFDPNGVDLPYRVYAATQGGGIYEIQENGTANEIFFDNQEAFESLVVPPKKTATYGTLAGMILAFDQKSGDLVIVNPTTGAATTVDLQWYNTDSRTWTYPHTEVALLMPALESDLWFIDYTDNVLYKINHPDDTLPAGAVVLVTEDPSVNVYCNGADHTISFWLLQYNSGDPEGIDFEPIIVTDRATGLDLGAPDGLQLQGAAWVPH